MRTLPIGAGSTCRAIGRTISHSSRFTMVHTTRRAPPGSFRGGRSTMAEYWARSRGKVRGLLPVRVRASLSQQAQRGAPADVVPLARCEPRDRVDQRHRVVLAHV